MVRHYCCLISNDIDLVHLVNTRVNTHQIDQIYHIYVDLRESMYCLVKSTGTLATRGKNFVGAGKFTPFSWDQPMAHVVSVWERGETSPRNQKTRATVLRRSDVLGIALALE